MGSGDIREIWGKAIALPVVSGGPAALGESLRPEALRRHLYMALPFRSRKGNALQLPCHFMQKHYLTMCCGENLIGLPGMARV